MALDTAVKRNSAIHITSPWRSLPLPTGTVSSGERLGLLYLYEFPRSVVMPCVAGSYAVSGVSADLLATRFIVPEAGAYSVTGTDAGLFQNRVVAAESGSYVVTGEDVSLSKMLTLIADPGAFTITGSDVLVYLVANNNDEFVYSTFVGVVDRQAGTVFEFNQMSIKKTPVGGTDFEYQKV
jgi:hypothetical protein